MKIRTSELTDYRLDWAVAKCVGLLAPDGVHLSDEYCDRLHADQDGGFSTDWAQGGPIIERHIFVLEDRETDDEAPERWMAQAINGVVCFGQTPLIAAMRAYVTAMLGDEIDVPEELA